MSELKGKAGVLPFVPTGPVNGVVEPQCALLYMNIGHTADGNGVTVGVAAHR